MDILFVLLVMHVWRRLRNILKSRGDRRVRQFIPLAEDQGVFLTQTNEELESAVRILEAHGFVDDITFNNTARFQMSESFVQMLKEAD